MTLDLPRLAQGLPWLFIDFTRPGVRISHSKQENRPYLSAESIFLVLKEQKVVHPFSLDSFAVQRLEVQRWRDILAVPYANYKSMLVPR
jgi:hypothetical protein